LFELRNAIKVSSFRLPFADLFFEKNTHMTDTESATTHSHGLPVPVVVVDNDEALVACVAEISDDLSTSGPEQGRVIGLDCEWRPGSQRLAILQLATSQRVCFGVIFQKQFINKYCLDLP
jgi:hypothetical protein